VLITGGGGPIAIAAWDFNKNQSASMAGFFLKISTAARRNQNLNDKN
jgi:hypothetical protein